MARPKVKAKPHPERHALYVRANDRANEALKDLIHAVRKTKVLGKVTQEDLVCATWIWMETLDPSDLARKLLPFMADVTGETTEKAKIDLMPPEVVAEIRQTPETKNSNSGLKPKPKRKQSL